MWTKEEQADHREQLVRALMDGKYRQSHTALRRNDKFCVLGVACDLSMLGTWQGDEDSMAYVVGNEWSSIELADSVAEYYGFASTNPEVHYNGRLRTLMSLNDGQEMPFNKLAELIDHNIRLEEDWI